MRCNIVLMKRFPPLFILTGLIIIFVFTSWELNAQAAHVLPPLYSFSSHTFTNCGATGYNGPTLANCKSSYDTSWEDDTDFFNVQTQGFQEWTVPASGTYSFVLKGASGGGGLPNCNCSSLTSGGGGGSYDSTSNATISLLSSSGHGQVIITLN